MARERLAPAVRALRGQDAHTTPSKMLAVRVTLPSRRLWRERLAPAVRGPRGQDPRATASETLAVQVALPSRRLWRERLAPAIEDRVGKMLARQRHL